MLLRHENHIAVYLILRKGEKILLGVRQNTGYMDGHHGLPSGHIEANESGIDALRREAMEEVGIELEEVKLVHVSHSKTDREYLNLFFECQQWSGEIQNPEPDKCAGWAFFDQHALPDTLIPSVQEVILSSRKGQIYSEKGWI